MHVSVGCFASEQRRNNFSFVVHQGMASVMVRPLTKRINEELLLEVLLHSSYFSFRLWQHQSQSSPITYLPMSHTDMLSFHLLNSLHSLNSISMRKMLMILSYPNTASAKLAFKHITLARVTAWSCSVSIHPTKVIPVFMLTRACSCKHFSTICKHSYLVL